MEKIDNFFKSVDLLGKDMVKFRLEKYGGDTFKTRFGGAISLLIYLVSIPIIVYFGMELFDKNSPAVTTKIDHLPTEKVENLNSPDFQGGSFAFSIYRFNNSDMVDDRRFFSISGSMLNVDTGRYIPINFEPCSNTTVDGNYNKYGEFNGYYCPNFNSSFGDMYLKEEYFFTQPSIGVYRCSKADEIKYNFTCYTPAEVANIYGLVFYLDLLIENKFFVPENFDNPIKKEYEYKFYYLQSYGYGYDIQLTYNPAQVISDAGFVFQDLTTKNFTQLQSTEFYNTGNFNYTRIFSIEFYSTNKQHTYERVYIRLQDSLSNIGGLMELIVQVCSFFMSFYVDYKYNLFLYQTLFKFNLKSYIEPEQPETKRHISTSVLIPKISDKELRELKEIKNIDTEQNKMLETGINTDRNNDKFYSDKKLGNILKRVDEESDVNGNDIDFGTGDRSRSGIKKTFNHLGIGIPIKEVNNNNINSDDKIKNKEIKSAIKTRKGHFPVIINAWTKLGRIICRCCYKKMSKEYINQKLCEGLIENADKEIAKKFEVTEVFKALNELRLIKELVLDENDCYLLENTEKQTITNQVIEQEKQDKINKENEKENFKNLLQYLKSKEKDYQISKFKFHLLRNLKQELKDEIKHHFDDFKKKVVKD